MSLMMHNALRSFIREALLSGSEEDLVSTQVGKLGAATESDDTTLSPYASLTGKKFAFTTEGEPQIVVVSESIDKNKLLIKKYSQSNADNDEIIRAFNAQQVNPDDPVINDILVGRNGWKSDAPLWNILNHEVDRRKGTGDLYFYDENGVIDRYYLIDRDMRKLHRPKFISTKGGQQKAIAFECTLPMSDVVDIIIKKPKGWINGSTSDKDWAQAAACCYSYANSIEGAALAAAAGAFWGGFLGGASGVAAGAAGGPPGEVVAASVFSMTGMFTGIRAGLTYPDLVLRIPVVWWAYKNGNNRVLTANIVWMFITATSGFISKLVGGLPLEGVKKLSAQFAAAVLEFAVQLGAAVGISISDMLDVQLVEYLYNHEEALESVLNESSANLLEYIRRSYPEF